jgi:hypothetical protein
MEKVDTSCITYKGYRIYCHMKSINRHNPISGHSWTEPELTSKFYVSGKGARVTDLYTSVKAAQEHIDFLIKFPFPE